MTKIVSTALLSFRMPGALVASIPNVVKFKPPSRKAAEVSATVFGDTAKKRIPGLPDVDGCQFSVLAPNAVSGLASRIGALEICVVNTDASKAYWAVMGSLALERSEADVEGDTVDSIDATLSADGPSTSIGLYGPALTASAAATASKIALSGSYAATVRLSSPCAAQTTVAIGGQTITIPARKTSATATITLSSATADLLTGVFSGFAPAGTYFSVTLQKA